MSDPNLMWSDILAIEIIRTGLNVWQFLDWSDILSDHFRKVIIPTGMGWLFSETVNLNKPLLVYCQVKIVTKFF